MTSNSPTAVTEIRDTLLGRGVQVLDAPAGGGVAAARQGSLLLLVGGEAEASVGRFVAISERTVAGNMARTGSTWEKP
jgi:3-hydroxyisobutyrate dehydrogenase-like beta-hydroxyacid dehydrogenase